MHPQEQSASPPSSHMQYSGFFCVGGGGGGAAVKKPPAYQTPASSVDVGKEGAKTCRAMERHWAVLDAHRARRVHRDWVGEYLH